MHKEQLQHKHFDSQIPKLSLDYTEGFFNKANLPFGIRYMNSLLDAM